MKTNMLSITAVASIVISAVVLLGSMHAAKVVADHKSLHDDTNVAKLSVDLHHHNTDKGQFGDQSMHADSRSLKLHRTIKHKSRHVPRLHEWWQLHGLHLG